MECNFVLGGGTASSAQEDKGGDESKGDDVQVSEVIFQV